MSITNHVVVSAELQGTIVGLFVEAGSSVSAGDVLALVESMKMHHEVIAPVSGVIDVLGVGDGDTVTIGQELARIAPGERDVSGAVRSHAVAASPVGLARDDLREVIERHAVGLDEQRPQAVERRRARGGARPGKTSLTSSTTAPSSSTEHW